MVEALVQAKADVNVECKYVVQMLLLPLCVLKAEAPYS